MQTLGVTQPSRSKLHLDNVLHGVEGLVQGSNVSLSKSKKHNFDPANTFKKQGILPDQKIFQILLGPL